MEPEAVVALRRIEPLHAPFWEVLDEGTAHTRDYFAKHAPSAVRDPFLAGSLTRFHAKLSLERRRDSGAVDLEIADVANIGLRVRFGDDELWILKAFRGGVPAPGRSRRRQEIWHWPMLEGFEAFAAPAVIPAKALLVIWDVDDRYELTEITLARPAGGNLDPSSGRALWAVPIPRPDFVARLAQEVHQVTVTLDDLSTIRPRRQELTGTDAASDDLR